MLEKISTKLKTLDIPFAYEQFRPDELPELPYICYKEDVSNNFYADGVVYFKISRIVVELYTQEKDISSEVILEDLFSEYKWTKSSEWIEDEKCFLTTYEMEV